MHLFLSLILFIGFPIFTQGLQKIDHTAIDSMVQKMQKASNTPAIALSIVHKQDLFYQKSFGVRDIRSQVPIDNKTLFRIGSASKSFTATLIVKYQQENLLDYYDLVSNHLPCFVLKDPQATSLATIHDLLTHQIGLARHDVMWYNRDFTSHDLLTHLRFVEASCSFRQHFLYQNLGYTILGLIIENVKKCTFQQALENDLLIPLGMHSTFIHYKDMKNTENFAKGHKRIGSKQVVCTEVNADCIAPAGSMVSNNEDMAKYLAFLNSKGGHILQKDQFNKLITPRVVSNTLPDFLKEEKIKDIKENKVQILDFECYGYGWILINYRGIKVAFHAGNIEGHTAFVCFIPEHQIAISVLSNHNMQIAPHILAIHLIDELLGLPKIDWLAYYDHLNQQATDYYVTSNEELNIKITPSRPINKYIGVYENGAYGPIQIEVHKDELILILRKSRYKLLATHPDIFSLSSMEDDSISIMLDKIRCQFTTDLHGNIQAFYLPFDPMAPPIKFKKTNKKQMLLQKYLGTYHYEPYNTDIYVAQNKGELLVKIMGYEFTLVQQPGGYFTVLGKDEYTVTFQEDLNKNIKAITLHDGKDNPMIASKIQ